ncbi:P-loop containing nucleoside triphosphate hydrolase protein [Podospora appendiculata]|uniref:P-loop containing nucleoside triphosphate hydrolase protein n=1 Tax=Podospora appendiculata TaxID=314037 RepID=A0AAE0X7Q4_9PEZI|nr:P-loop containing nucleoside triphosphate hydrolase protein [Podospora appendiculata]
MKTQDFRIRKVHVNTDAEKRLLKRQPSRVYVNEEVLIELTGGKDGGKAICIEKAPTAASVADEPPVRYEATLWKAPEKLDKAVTQMYDAFRESCGYKLGEHVRITTLGGSIPNADEIVLKELKAPSGDQEADPEPIDPVDIPGWEFLLSGRLSLVEHVYAGLVFKNLFARGPERSFVVASVNGRPAGNARYLDRKTVVKIANDEEADGAEAAAPGELKVTGIRGIDPQIDELNGLLGDFTTDFTFKCAPSYPAILIHGGHGTGKTMLLDAIAKTGWGTVHRVQFKDKLAEIHEVFQKAKLQQPSIVIIDQLERLIDKERNNRGAVIQTICEALDELSTETETTGQAPKVVVVAACLDYTTDVPDDLKEPGRFTNEIYLPLPDVAGRREILTALNLCVEPAREQEIVRSLSERTHAYNGKDLKRLVHKVRLIGHKRIQKARSESKASQESETKPDADGDADANGNLSQLVEKTSALEIDGEQDAEQPPGPEEKADETTSPSYFTADEIEEALRIVRPSAMHDINLKPPPIRWDDIGGQNSVKTSLRRAVRLSNESTEVLKKYFEHPPKGFLLYGPPGCSKTMAAQAMATESGLNFFAVKGAELLNMYVGESERAIRRLFQRAREVAPSMIFFDEIDAIAGQRQGFGSGAGGGKGATTSHGGLNVLTTLLNEMDGFEALQGVVVLAATNRPQALDPALLRPGRFDELIYVSPPDEEARRAIFKGVAARREMNDDVDIDKLARDTEGYSGAEIKGICAVAGIAAYDRFYKSLDAGGDGADEDGRPASEGGVSLVGGGIMMRDLEMAIRNQKRQITREMVQGFEEWEEQFRNIVGYRACRSDVPASAPPGLNDPAILDYRLRRSDAPARPPPGLNDPAIVDYRVHRDGRGNASHFHPALPGYVENGYYLVAQNGPPPAPVRRTPEPNLPPAFASFTAHNDMALYRINRNRNGNTVRPQSSRSMLNAEDRFQSAPNRYSPPPARRALELNDPAIVRFAARNDNNVPQRSTNNRTVDRGDLRLSRPISMEELFKSTRSSQARQPPTPTPHQAAGSPMPPAPGPRFAKTASGVPPAPQSRLPEDGLAFSARVAAQADEQARRHLLELECETSDEVKRTMAEAEEAAERKCREGRYSLPPCSDSGCECGSCDSEEEDGVEDASAEARGA